MSTQDDARWHKMVKDDTKWCMCSFSDQNCLLGTAFWKADFLYWSIIWPKTLQTCGKWWWLSSFVGRWQLKIRGEGGGKKGRDFRLVPSPIDEGVKTKSLSEDFELPLVVDVNPIVCKQFDIIFARTLTFNFPFTERLKLFKYRVIDRLDGLGLDLSDWRNIVFIDGHVEQLNRIWW